MNNVHVKPENDSTASSPVIAVDRPIPVMEIFGPTVQGEGMVVGRKTMFVRTAGRDYRAPGATPHLRGTDRPRTPFRA